MDKDRIEGSANQAKGAIKEAAGKVTGDAKLQAEGAADKASRQGAERRRRREGCPQGRRQALNRSSYVATEPGSFQRRPGLSLC